MYGMRKDRQTIFKFKQFDIHNERSAMKVGTDGVLLGAWCHIPSQSVVWDVGAGTGLISIMLAQRFATSLITAIEIDSDAACEAERNAKMSPWGDRIRIVEGDIMNVYESLPRPDVIISNPPFFKNGLKAPDQARAMARNGASLSFSSLISLASEVLSDDGRLVMISPVDDMDEIEFETAMHRLYVKRKCMVRSKPDVAAKRILWEFTKTKSSDTVLSELCIRDSEERYSDDYRSITRDFYLNF